MTVTFDLETWIAAPPAAVFDASLDIDAHLASMEGSCEEAVGTVMRDHIEFDAPLRLLGDLVERLILGACLPKRIVERNRHLREALER